MLKLKLNAISKININIYFEKNAFKSLKNTFKNAISRDPDIQVLFVYTDVRVINTYQDNWFNTYTY